MATTMSVPSTKKNNSNVHMSGYSVSKNGIDSHPFHHGVPTLRKKKKTIEWSNGKETTFEDYIDLIRRKNPDAKKDKQHILVKDDGLVVKKDSSSGGSQIVTAEAFQRSREKAAQKTKKYSQTPKGKKTAAKKEENRRGRRIRKEVVSGTVPSSANSRDKAELEVYANMNKEFFTVQARSHQSFQVEANTGFRRIANDQRRHRRPDDKETENSGDSNTADSTNELGSESSDDADDSEEEESESESELESDDSADEKEEEDEFYESTIEDKNDQYGESRDDGKDGADNHNSASNAQGSHRCVIGVDKPERRYESPSTNEDTNPETNHTVAFNIPEGNNAAAENHRRTNNRPSRQNPITTVDEAERCDGNRFIAGNVVAPVLLAILSFIIPQGINVRRDYNTKSDEEKSPDDVEEQQLDCLPRANLFTPTTPSRLSGPPSSGPDGEDHDFDGVQVSITQHCKKRCLERGVQLSGLKNVWKHGSEQPNTDHLDDVDGPTRKFVYESITVITSMDKRTLVSTWCDERCEMQQPPVDVNQKSGETPAEMTTRIRREVDDLKFYYSCKALADTIATSRQMKREKNLAYEDGRDDGYREGEQDGYREGDRDGYRQGQQDGYRQGQQDGYRDGYDEGYYVGEQQGRENEWDDLHPRPLRRRRTHR